MHGALREFRDFVTRGNVVDSRSPWCWAPRSVR